MSAALAKEFNLSDLRNVRPPNASGWGAALCPMHDDTRPSLGINYKSGWAVCRACGGKARVRGTGGTAKYREASHRRNRAGESLTATWLECNTIEILHNTMVEVMLLRRGIEPEIAANLGMCAMRNGGQDWLCFVYFDEQYRPCYMKRRRADGDKSTIVRWPRGSASLLYNLPGLNELNDDEPPIIVEGELDVAAMYAVGQRGVVSVPDGAGTALHDGVLAPLHRFNEVLLAVDDDEAGHRLRDKLAALLPMRCRSVTWRRAS